MLRVVDYSRVSTEEEKQLNALKTQQHENEEFISKHEDWVLVDRYVDEGQTATTIKGRNDFKRLIEDIQTDKFDIVLIKVIDRGWRNLLDWKMFEYEMYKSGKRLFVRLRNDFYNLEDDASYISTNMDAMFAEWSSRNLSKKMNNAHQTRMDKGTVVTNGKTWGYNQVDAQLEINEEEAEIVRYIFDAYIQGKGFRTIANELEKKGIRNKEGGSFALTTLKRIIRQEKYKGTLICGKRHYNFFTKKYDEVPPEKWKIHENAVPAIVSPEIWQKANDILDSKRKTFGTDEEKKQMAGYFHGLYAYSGKIKCGKCGRPYYHSRYVYKNGAGAVVQWECRGYREFGSKVENNGCDNTRVKDNEMDEVIKQAIYDFWTNKDENVKRVIDILNNILSENAGTVSFSKIKKDKERLIKKKDKLIELYSDELLSKEEFKVKNEEYTEQIKKIDIIIEETTKKDKETIVKRDRLLKIQELFNKKLSSKESINDDIINTRLKDVMVYPDNKIEITLYGDFELSASNSHNAITTGSNRYSHRSKSGKI